MKQRVFAAVLAAAMVLSLAACGGGNNNGGGSSASNSGSGSADGSGASSSQPSGSGNEGASSVPSVFPDITLNKTEITLNKAGATFQLRYTIVPDGIGIPVSFRTSDEKVATVDGEGVITAVASGEAIITVEGNGATATCTVTCDWKEETKPETKPDTSKPSNKPDTSKPSGGSSSSSGGGSSSAANVDLQAFYTTITGKYEFGFLELADSAILEQLYPGMSGISLEQNQIYYCMMSMNNGEFALVQVKDSKDVDAVKAAFQARIDYMVGDGNGPGGAWYPGLTEQWQNNSRIVSNGNYVMMIVHENCDDIVNDFNALF